LETLQELTLPRTDSIPSMIVSQSMQLSTGFELGMQDRELLSKFKTRTGLTISTASSLRLFPEELFMLACSVKTSASHVANLANQEASAFVLDACGTTRHSNA